MKHRSARLNAWSLGLAAAMGLIGEAALAQAAADTTTLEEVVVTATRLPLARDFIAARVTVLEADELRAEGVTRLSEALRRVPGLHVVQSGSPGSVTSVFLRGGQSDYVQVLVDGVPVNEPGGAVDLADLQLDNVERIEIVHGPVSVLYGSDAVTGVVQVFTRDGGTENRVAFEGRAGSLGAVEVSGQATGGSGTAGYAIMVSHSETDGVLPFNNGYRNTGLAGAIRTRPDHRTDLKFAVRYTDARFQFPTDGGGVLVDSNQLALRESAFVAWRPGYSWASRNWAVEGGTSRIPRGTRPASSPPARSGTWIGTRRICASMRASGRKPG
jgi:vitamin B12 transporter